MRAFIPQGNHADAEDFLIVAMMFGMGLFAIVLAGEGWGVQPTIGMLIAFFAIKQLVEHRAPRGRAPRHLRKARLP